MQGQITVTCKVGRSSAEVASNLKILKGLRISGWFTGNFMVRAFLQKEDGVYEVLT